MQRKNVFFYLLICRFLSQKAARVTIFDTISYRDISILVVQIFSLSVQRIVFCAKEAKLLFFFSRILWDKKNHRSSMFFISYRKENIHFSNTLYVYKIYIAGVPEPYKGIYIALVIQFLTSRVKDSWKLSK